MKGELENDIPHKMDRFMLKISHVEIQLNTTTSTKSDHISFLFILIWSQLNENMQRKDLGRKCCPSICVDFKFDSELWMM